MGGVWLTWLPGELRAARLDVVTYDGWETRARSSGGYNASPLCVMEHHTASPSSWDGQRDADYCAVGDEDAPLCNLYIDRGGRVWVLAAGATNCNGKGQAMTFSRGTAPANSMNSYAVAIECGNGGTGEPWPQAQVDALIAAANVVNRCCGNRPDDIAGHVHYAPDRKVDPATATAVQGPWQPRSINGSGSWNLDDMRAEHVRRATTTTPEPLEDDEMTIVAFADNGSGWWAFPPGLWCKISIGSADKDALVAAGTAKVAALSDDIILRAPTTYEGAWQPHA